MTEPQPVAVVVPVLNEAESLPGLLADLKGQLPPLAEIVVVDAGSHDGTRDLLQQEKRRLAALLVLEADGSTPGRGRNAGIAAASADLVVTLDAGSRVGPGFVAVLAAAAGPRTVSVGVAEADARTAFDRAVGWFTLRAFKPRDRPGPVGAEFLPAGRNGLCFSRKAWQAVGGYPPELPWGEDKLFVRALREVGYELAAVPEAVVRWRPRRSLGELYRQYRHYGHGDALGRVDRQNELVTIAIYGAGAVLVALTLLGSRAAGALLAAGVAAYISVFVVAARRALGFDRALAWVPLVRVLVDVAKVHGFLEGTLRRRTG